MAQAYETLVLERTASTQDEVRTRASRCPLLVVAGRQTLGRGRSGARWENAPRSLAASLGVRPSWPIARWPIITLAAGVAALRCLSARADRMRLKWPNDLIREDRKLGGLLAESFGGLVVVGWGANLYWPDPPEGRGAVFPTDPGPDAALRLARRWADELLGILRAGVDEWPYDEYRRLCATIGQEVTWAPQGRGTALEVAPTGGLEVATAEGPVTLFSGDVSEVRSTRQSPAPILHARGLAGSIEDEYTVADLG